MNKYKENTILGIVTCNREDMLLKLVNSIDINCFSNCLIINNGAPLKHHYDGFEVIQSNRNPTPVGPGKNRLIRRALEINKECNIFILEEDVEILDNAVWEKYVDTMNESGIIGQLSFALHGGISSGNILPDGTINPREVVQYKNTSVSFFQNSYAAFSLYHGSVFSKVGYMDEQFVNAAEHLEHYQRTANMLNACPFWYFPDITDSHLYIKDQDQNFERSAIRNQPDFKKNFSDGWHLFKKKHGVFPTEMPDLGKQQLMQRLESMEENYGRA
jgi:hypothetical protein